MNPSKDILETNFADSGAYDRRIRRFVPYYEEMMNSVLDCLPELDRPRAVLELGCGTGNLSEKLLKKNAFLKLIAIDITKEMVESCQTRLSQYVQRAEVIYADMMKFKRLNSFDYVVSNLSLHYPETHEKKISVCRNIYQSLKPGGTLSFSVMMESDAPESAIKTWKRWEMHVRRHGVTREELGDWRRTHHVADHPVPPSFWLEWLRGVGFKHCELVWRKTIFGTIQAGKL